MSSLYRLPAPGELLWSAACRLRQRFPQVGEPPTEQLLACVRLFRRKLFPTNLESHVRTLSHLNKPTVDEILAHHTLFPFVLPFLEVEEARALRESTRRETSWVFWRHRCHRMIGMPDNAALRFCPDCVQADIQRTGIPAWRCFHQIGCLQLCPEHECELVATDILCSDPHGTALSEVVESYPRPPARKTSNLQLALAENIRSIVGNLRWEIGRGQLVVACQAEIKRSGRGVRPRPGLAEFVREIETKFDPAELAACDASTAEPGSSWVRGVVSGKWNQRFPRLYLQHYAIVCATIGLTLKQLFETATKVSLPERGPWPCMSDGLACSGKNLIARFLAFPSGRAQFACPVCGTTYYRTLPLERGDDGTFAFRLRVTSSQLAAREAAARVKRNALLEYQASHPGVPISEAPRWAKRYYYNLRKSFPALAPAFVRKPRANRRAPREPREWATRDAEVVQIIDRHSVDATAALYHSRAPRVTRRRVRRFLAPLVTIARSSLPHLPKTNEAILRLVETGAAFSVRRVNEVVTRIRAAQDLPGWSKMAKAYGFDHWKVAERAQIRSAYLAAQELRRLVPACPVPAPPPRPGGAAAAP